MENEDLLCHYTTYLVVLLCVTNHRIVKEHRDEQRNALETYAPSLFPDSSRLAAGQGVGQISICRTPHPAERGLRLRVNVVSCKPSWEAGVSRFGNESGADAASCLIVNLPELGLFGEDHGP